MIEDMFENEQKKRPNCKKPSLIFIPEDDEKAREFLPKTLNAERHVAFLDWRLD
jgi:hypothetical protein